MNGTTLWNAGLIKRVVLVVAWGLGCSLPAQFVAFNEHLGGAATSSNTTVYSVKPPSASNAGLLRDITNGALTGVTLTVTNTPGLSVGSSSGTPNAGSPAEWVFGGRVTFGNGYVNLGTNQVVAHVLSGLDPNKLYSLKGTTVRGNATSAFPNRWTLFELAGAILWTNQHSAGCLTNGRAGVNLASHQVALATGDNRGGELLAWEGIVPDTNGVVVIYSRKFYGTNVPGVVTNDWVGTAYALEALRLEETATSPPWISVQPRDCQLWPGDSNALVVVAGGSPPLAYQWFKGLNPSNALVGATNSVYVMDPVQAADTGYYTLVVSNPIATLSSRAALVTVLTNPPVITSPPTNVTAFYGGPASFTARVSGSGPIYFQWFKEGAVIPGATNNFFSLSPTTGEDAGTYTIVASNRVGAVSASATLTLLDTPLVITNQPQSQAGLLGSNLTFAVGVSGPNPWFQWFYNGLPLSGATNATLTLLGLTPNHVGGYGVVVTNGANSVTSQVAMLTVVPPPLPDSLNAAANSAVWCVAVQPDGKILLGGDFTTLSGQSHAYLGRLDADGSLDSSFTVGAESGSVFCLAVQPDGKILLGGNFTALGGQPCRRIARLNPDGSVDVSFNPGASNTVWTLVVQPDGRIVVGGDFTTLGGVARNRIGRLNADGSVDAGFDPGANSTVYTLLQQPDGKILVGGNFGTLAGQTRSRLGRLNSDGTIETAFNPGASTTVRCLALQADGKILVGGEFSTLGGQARSRIGRLQADGTVDGAFNPGASGTVYSMVVQTDGGVLVGGSFGTLGGEARNNLGRLNAEGSLDGSFAPGASSTVRALGLQADGKVVVGGSFSTLGGQSRGYLGRLSNTAPATQGFLRDGATLTWQRGGTSPEVTRVTFETSPPEGTGWVNAGAGVRVSGGWQCEGGDLPANTSVRARGFVTGGYCNGSSWFVETVFSPPHLTGTPRLVVTNVGALIALTAPVEGATPIGCRWQKDGVDLEENAHWIGTHSNVLTIVNTLGTDSGFYSVVLTNLLGPGGGLVAQVRVMDPFITAQPQDQEAFRGNTVVLSVTVTGSSPLSYQWYKSTLLLPGATGSVLTLSNIQPADSGGFWVVASNPSGSVTSQVATVTVLTPATTDFFNPGANSTVYALAAQPDGKLLVGGNFSTLAGQSRLYLGRLNSDGIADLLFNPGADSTIYSLIVQPDGKIVAGGSFTTLGGQPRSRLGRLNPEGSPDLGFTAAVDSTIQCLALQADGLILVGGQFSQVNGQARSRLARLKANGILDAGFDPGANGTVYSLAVQLDGKILVGGNFTTLAGQTRRYLGRLNSDGSVDNAFNPGADWTVYSLVVQPDGKVLVGGAFATLGGLSRNYIGRLNPDGAVEASFNPGADSYVYSLALQSDGKILAGGGFNTLGGQPRRYLGRLKADGSVDPTFDPSATSTIYALGLQADGKVLVGGSFGTLGGQSRSYLGRLNNTLPSTQSWSWHGLELTWRRGGSGPEIWRAAFELTTDGGATWADLSPVVRVAGGWQYAGMEPPPNATVRARGSVTGGYRNGCGWVVEDWFGAPVITTPPQELLTNVGAQVVLTAEVKGVPPFAYQWQKDGVDLNDGPGLSGTRSNVLTLSGLQADGKGFYSLVVSNAGGMVSVWIASLKVIDPLITRQPASQIAWLGTNVMFVAAAGGTPPLSYQWLKGGLPLPGATGAVLTVTNVQWADDGSQYSLLVNNDWGTDISAVATLTVVSPPLPDSLNPAPNSTVYCLAGHLDGKLLLGGDFTTLYGLPRTCLGRLNKDGTLDTAFNPGAEPASVLSLTVQPDGAILVGGGFSYLGGQPRSRLGRLSADGTLDLSFNPGADGPIRTVLLQEDGRILLGGDFTTLAGQPRNRLGRLYANGSLDADFNPGANGSVYSLALQKGGRIVVAGGFSTLAGQSRSYLGRLNADGTFDASFAPTPNSTVRCLLGRADGTILVGGDFTTFGGLSCSRVARLQSDGGLDTTFNASADATVYSMVAQVDGRVLVAGSFAGLGGQARGRLGRLNLDGSTDLTFNPGADSTVYALGLQGDGSILAGGSFSTVAGVSRGRFARLANTQPFTPGLTVEGTTATWLRGANAPDLAGASFGVSTNGGLDWVELGPGTPIAGGWEFSGLAESLNRSVRARGVVAGGIGNASAGFVESRAGAPTLSTQPLSLFTNAWATVVLSVMAEGTAPLGWQWQKDGVNLADDGRRVGAHSNVFVLLNAQVPDTGSYTVLVSNALGGVSRLVAQLVVADPFITAPPADWIGSPGSNAYFHVQTIASWPASYQWYRGGVAIPDATSATLVLTNLQLSDDGSRFAVVVSNSFGCVTSLSASLTVVWPVGPDSANPSPNSSTYSLAVQADGKILLGGYFSTLGGQTHNYLGRLLPDGNVDATFTNGTDYIVYSIAVQPDGRTLLGGDFGVLGGQNRSRIGRLNADGTVDTNFNPGASSTVYSLAVQPDGKILLGGGFYSLAGQTRSYIGRLNSDGSLDTNFNLGCNSTVYTVALQPDGKILVGGYFSSLGGQTRNYLGRVNSDGSLDTSFNPNPDSVVYSLAVQPDGKIVVGGGFSALGGRMRTRLARLLPDGTAETSFNPGADSTVYSLTLQADGKILVGGGFYTLAGQTRNFLGRLEANGNLDATFNPGPNSTVYALGVQADGRVLAAGTFSSLGGQSRGRFGRLSNTVAAAQSLNWNGSTLTWLRGGASPEVWRTSFEMSTNGGTTWTGLGSGTRLPGGWQLTGVQSPPNSSVRARGFVTGGAYSGSSGLVETRAGAPILTTQPLVWVTNAGATLLLNVAAEASAPVYWRWQKDGTDLPEGGRWSGTWSNVLMVTNLQGADAGAYSIFVSNSFGVTSGLVATVTVVDPLILTQPAAQVAVIGGSASFQVEALGTPPLTYQWYEGGMPLPETTTAALQITNAQWNDDGRLFSVVVSNAAGSVTSAVARLSVVASLVAPDSLNPSVNTTVWSLAVQPDGKILFGGDFTSVGGVSRTYLARVNPDGSLDNSFALGAETAAVLALVVQPDGQILVAGSFTALAGETRNRLGRLTAGGTLDTSFNPGADGSVQALLLQPDGCLLAGGDFGTLGGQARSRIARLKPDGSVETTFNPGADGRVCSLALQPDGKIVVAGSFATLAGQARSRLGRLNPDGSLDSSFNPALDATVQCVVIQADGRILIGGSFTTVAGQPRSRLARLQPDGSLDGSFNPSADGTVYSMLLQTDGQILVGGGFVTLGGQPRSRLGRLTTEGTLDIVFNPGANGTVYALGVQADGSVLAGGAYSLLGGLGRSRFGRLSNSRPATQDLTWNGSAATWLRGGTGPEVSSTTLEVSTNHGVSWATLAAGRRVPGGWEFSPVELPSEASVRARGWVNGAYGNGSSWLVESVAGVPFVTTPPQTVVTNVGATVVLTASASGTPPLDWSWQKDGVVLEESAQVVGTHSNVLVLLGLQPGDTGTYAVVVSNGFGGDSSLVAQIEVRDPFITSQPASQTVWVGSNVLLSVTAAGASPLTFQWFRDGVLLPESTEPSLTVSNVQLQDQGSAWTVVVADAAGSVTSTVALLTVVLPPVPDGFNPSPSSTVYSLAVQPDGNILVGGGFSTLAGQLRYYLGRLLPDGSLESAFAPAPDSTVYAILLQPDGRVVVGGAFGSLGGQARPRLGRLLADGSLDPGFNPGANNSVYSLLLQPDGKILVGGSFSTLAGQTRSYVGRLNQDGTLDASFNPGPNSTVYALALQPDGRILVGGSFSSIGGQSRNYLARLNADGSADPTFNPGADSTVFAFVVQADGRILVGGGFSTLGGRARSRLGRLLSDGSVEVTFNPGADYTVYSLVQQTDGKVLVGGSFYFLGGQTRAYLGRLNADGSLDLTFNPGANSSVYALGLQSDGAILVGGGFSTLGGQSRNRLGRLGNTTVAEQSLSWTGSTVTWSRGGASPEVSRTTLERSTDGGTTWGNPVSGQRLPGGWKFDAWEGSPNVRIRARGFLSGGEYGGSGWFVEARGGAPSLVTQPQLIATNAGATLVLRPRVEGEGLLNWQWQKDGADLVEGNHFLGTRSNALVIVGLQAGDAGTYSVRVSNSLGQAGGTVALVTVVDPLITLQPLDQATLLGGTAAFQVQAAGTPPLTYQWFRGGLLLEGATAPTLNLTNLQWSDDGGLYQAVVTSPGGRATSAVATLAVVVSPLGLDSFAPSPSTTVWSLAVQPDGRILLGGNFTSVAGQTRNYLARINADGTLDTAFNPGAGSTVLALALQEDGKIVVAGSFTTLAGQPRNRLGRLASDGTLEAAFDPSANGSIQSVLLQADGRILVGGSFTTLGGATRQRIGRLYADGSLEGSFNPGADGSVVTLALQPDGKILVGGNFTTLTGQPRTRLGRLNSDGSLDPAFNPGADGTVQCLAVQPDGRILVGGDFALLGGQPRSRLARLLPDGSVDGSFNPGASGTVYTLVSQADGKILVGGAFATLGGQPRTSLGRLLSDGRADPGFAAAVGGTTCALAMQPDGKVLVAGAFSSLNGQYTLMLGRLGNTVPALESLAIEETSRVWLRGGAAPEIWRATFAASTDGGASWTNLGPGVRVPGGWQVRLVAPLYTTLVRARGFVAGAAQNGSGWFADSLLGPPSRPRFATGLDLQSSNGQMHLRLLDVPTWGRLVIEASLDLHRGWTPVYTNLAPTTVLDCTDVLGTNWPRRFYRALWQEP